MSEAAARACSCLSFAGDVCGSCKEPGMTRYLSDRKILAPRVVWSAKGGFNMPSDAAGVINPPQHPIRNVSHFQAV